MSDILSIQAGETLRKAGMVKRADGGPIVAGTVNYYLKALSGANAGKWWRDSDQSWQVAETANAMTFQADGLWTITLTTSPFTTGVAYLEYAKESGDLHVPAEGRLLRGVDEDMAQIAADTAATWAKVNGWSAPLVVYNGGASADGSILHLRQGDAYTTALGNALAWQSSTWIDLTGCTAQLIVVDQLTGNTLITEDAVITLGSPQIITVELTATQTRTLTTGKGTCRFAVVVTKGTDTLAVVVGVVHTTKE